jgi:hypothetical protein
MSIPVKIESGRKVEIHIGKFDEDGEMITSAAKKGSLCNNQIEVYLGSAGIRGVYRREKVAHVYLEMLGATVYLIGDNLCSPYSDANTPDEAMYITMKILQENLTPAMLADFLHDITVNAHNWGLVEGERSCKQQIRAVLGVD